MAKSDRLYFENLIEAADCSCVAANYLVKCLTEYEPTELKDMMTTMHEYEHQGDTKKHEMTSMLAKAFVTPVEREDLAMISQYIDDVTDSIEEVLQGLYMYSIKAMTHEAVDFANKLVECCDIMKEMLGEFINFKKPEKLRKLVVELNRVEEECDTLYVESTMLLNTRSSDALEIISWREIYNRMENCSDACEHVGDCIDMIVMKNS